jgi:hypothetical protein
LYPIENETLIDEELGTWKVQTVKRCSCSSYLAAFKCPPPRHS